MEIDVQAIPGDSHVTCVSIDGRIDAYTVDRVEEELNSLIRIGSSKLICDISEVEFVSSSGFKAFRRIIKFAREQEGDLKFCGICPEVMLLFHSVGFARETGIFASQEEALADFKSGGGNGDLESGAGIKSKISGLLNSVGLSKETESIAKSESRRDDPALLQTQILSKDSALKKTVVIPRSNSSSSGEDPSGPIRYACFEPVRMTLFAEASQYQNLSQILGAIGSLVGFSSTDLVKLNVAVLEVCRSMVNELESEETFSIEIDSTKPGFRVHVDIPRNDYNLFENLQPKTSERKLTEKEGKEWLLNYVDEVEVNATDEGTRLLLLVSD